MGGLAKDMKITHICSIFGLLSLVGIPIWAGFFSKDMIMANLLEEGIYGPLILLIIATFFTAAYSWRLYWLTFQGESRTELKVHEAPWEMTMPLVILAAGSALFWLYISPYTSSMVFSLPQYPVAHIALGELIHHCFTCPIIWVTLAVAILLAIFTLKWRATVINAFQQPSALTLPLMRAYWVDIFYNRFVVKGLFGFWQWFRRMQTGDLNYNNLGIVIGFVIFLVLLFVWGI
jgi:NADH:ubiquinone oxidoreductase subunit 5 (subunit L)/multisubunit Na+/H+ antiporter MnhA subunit